MKKENLISKTWEYCTIWDEEIEIDYIIFKQPLLNNNNRIKIFKRDWIDDIATTIDLYRYPDSMFHNDGVQDCCVILFDFLINAGKNITEEEIKQKYPHFKWETIEIVEPERYSSGFFWMETKINDKDVTLVRAPANDYFEFKIKIFNFTYRDFPEYEDFSRAIVDGFEENTNIILEKDIRCYQEWNIK